MLRPHVTGTDGARALEAIPRPTDDDDDPPHGSIVLRIVPSPPGKGREQLVDVFLRRPEIRAVPSRVRRWLDVPLTAELIQIGSRIAEDVVRTSDGGGSSDRVGRTEAAKRPIARARNAAATVSTSLPRRLARSCSSRS